MARSDLTVVAGGTEGPTHRQLPAGPDAAFGRRLSDRVLLAFHQACEQQDIEVARRLIKVLEFMWTRDADAPWGRRRNVNFLVPARERLWHLLYVLEQPATLQQRQAVDRPGRDAAARNG